MDYELSWRRAELEEQFEIPWEWTGHHHYLDGWEINRNRLIKDSYLEEIGKELGAISLPHRYRTFGKL